MAYIDNNEITIDELMQHIPGPDFPTAALINGRKGIEEAYRTGRGKVYVRARATVETNEKGREQIIVSELPYQVNKAKLVEKIAELIREKKSKASAILLTFQIKKGSVLKLILNVMQWGSGIKSSLLTHSNASDLWYQYGGIGSRSATFI